jgi:hypothetical protein
MTLNMDTKTKTKEMIDRLATAQGPSVDDQNFALEVMKDDWGVDLSGVTVGASFNLLDLVTAVMKGYGAGYAAGRRRERDDGDDLSDQEKIDLGVVQFSDSEIDDPADITSEQAKAYVDGQAERLTLLRSARR